MRALNTVCHAGEEPRGREERIIRQGRGNWNRGSGYRGPGKPIFSSAVRLV